MNEKNLNYLKDNLKYLGFGEQLHESVEAAIKEGKPEFTLSFEALFNRQKIEATLHFKKSDQSDHYFFNKYEANLRQEQDAALDRQHTFYINKGSGVTMKEAFNLLNGRAVNKDLTNREGQVYNAWLQLDLKNKDASGQYPVNMYHERYGFDLEKVLSTQSIKELKDPQQKEALLKSLQKGNVQSVTFLTAVGQEKRFIEAAPQYKTINQYDEQFKPLRKEAEKKEVPNQEEGKSAKQKTGQGSGEDEEGPELTKKRTKKKGLSI